MQFFFNFVNPSLAAKQDRTAGDTAKLVGQHAATVAANAVAYGGATIGVLFGVKKWESRNGGSASSGEQTTTGE